jgi:putative hemolysin
VVTNADILEAIVGGSQTHQSEPDAVQREDGSWLIAGSMPVDEMADRLDIAIPQERSYHTAAGFVLDWLGHLPQIAESFDTQGWRFEIVDFDGRRVDKILATRLAGGRREQRSSSTRSGEAIRGRGSRPASWPGTAGSG